MWDSKENIFEKVQSYFCLRNERFLKIAEKKIILRCSTLINMNLNGSDKIYILSFQTEDEATVTLSCREMQAVIIDEKRLPSIDFTCKKPYFHFNNTPIVDGITMFAGCYYGQYLHVWPVSACIIQTNIAYAVTFSMILLYWSNTLCFSLEIVLPLKPHGRKWICWVWDYV